MISDRLTRAGRAARRTRRAAPEPLPIVGVARIDKRTKDLVKRLQPGEIAIIDHADIDRVAAETLVAAAPGAVVNLGPSITGRYPNGGPIRIVDAGISLVDRASPGLMDAVREGDVVEVRGGQVLREGEMLGEGDVLGRDEIEDAMERARDNVGAELQRFAENTLHYIQDEAPLMFEPVTLPPLSVSFRGRHALVVVRGHDYKSDLNALGAYMREYRPVLIGVDGGADALIEMGKRPDVIVGDFDSLSERALHCGADLVHHVHRDGRAPGRENLHAWGVPYEEFVMDGTSEDVAMVLAYESGAQLIVAVGAHATMVEFLDKGRRGMSSTFLTRLRLGPTLVDAKGVHRLYEGRARRRDMVLLVGSALVAMLAISIVAQPIHVFFDGLRLTMENFWHAIRGAF